MATTTDRIMCVESTATSRERVHYFPRQLLTADDMRVEQDYFLQKQRRHNRFLHGSGVVCGLNVIAAATTELPLQIQISPGYALGPLGDEIYLSDLLFLDLATCGRRTDTEDCQPASTFTADPKKEKEQLFVAIKYHACQTRPVRVMPMGCGCDESSCEYSRIRDSFEVSCLAKNPDPDLSAVGTTEGGAVNVRSCPPDPKHPWVVLANVTFTGTTTETTIQTINDLRRVVVSGAVI
jgi:hypothetical protein